VGGGQKTEKEVTFADWRPAVIAREAFGKGVMSTVATVNKGASGASGESGDEQGTGVKN